MTTRHPLSTSLSPPTSRILARIKSWFRFDIEALANASIAISGVYGAPITYVPLDVDDEAEDEKH